MLHKLDDHSLAVIVQCLVLLYNQTWSNQWWNCSVTSVCQ